MQAGKCDQTLQQRVRLQKREDARAKSAEHCSKRELGQPHALAAEGFHWTVTGGYISLETAYKQCLIGGLQR